jgi:type IV pilus assembly protein PilA
MEPERRQLGHVKIHTPRGYTMKKNMQGFTLIELMIVVAIIAILAAIAISQYQDYVIRTQVSEGSSLASGAKTAVTEFHNNKGTFGGDNSSIGLAPALSITGKYVSSVDASDGIITVAYNNGDTHEKIRSSVLVFSAVPDGGSMKWDCGTDKTTIEAKYLPTVCRD